MRSLHVDTTARSRRNWVRVCCCKRWRFIETSQMFGVTVPSSYIDLIGCCSRADIWIAVSTDSLWPIAVRRGSAVAEPCGRPNSLTPGVTATSRISLTLWCSLDVQHLHLNALILDS